MKKKLHFFIVLMFLVGTMFILGCPRGGGVFVQGGDTSGTAEEVGGVSGRPILYWSNQDPGNPDTTISYGGYWKMNGDGSGKKFFGVGNSTGTCAWSPDYGRIVYTALDGAIHIIKPDGSNDTVLIIPNAPDPASGNPLWVPDSSRVYFVGRVTPSDQWNIYEGRVDGTVTKLTDYVGTPSLVLSPRAISPDGTRLLFRSEDTSVYAINNKGLHVLALDANTSHAVHDLIPLGSPLYARKAQYSADETKIYVKIYDMQAQQTDLYTISLDAAGTAMIGSPVNLTSTGGTGDFDISPDGLKLAYGDGSGLYIMNVDGTELQTLATGRVGFVLWSPDGSQLLYSVITPIQSSGYAPGYVSNLWVVDSDDPESKIKITNFAGEELARSGFWSKDSSKIAFSNVNYKTGGKNNIYIVEADGSGITQLTDSDSISARFSVKDW